MAGGRHIPEPPLQAQEGRLQLGRGGNALWGQELNDRAMDELRPRALVLGMEAASELEAPRAPTTRDNAATSSAPVQTTPCGSIGVDLLQTEEHPMPAG